MKKAFITLCGCVMVFAGCMEKGPPINFSDIVVADTTYTVSVPATDPHNILAEEFTGQSCSNCPAAHELLNGIAAAGRMNILGLYIYGLGQTVPPTGAAFDFRNKTATDISDNIYAGGPKSGIPCAGIDRVPVSSQLILYSSDWNNAYNERLAMVDSVNLSVTSTFSDADTTVTIVALTTYVQTVSTKQNLSIAIVEDSMVDLQVNISGGTDDHYLFTNVFRGMVTSEPYGDPIASKQTIKVAGTQNKRTYTYKVNRAWNPKHCRIIAFVHYSNDQSSKDVFQSVQTKLVP